MLQHRPALSIAVTGLALTVVSALTIGWGVRQRDESYALGQLIQSTGEVARKLDVGMYELQRDVEQLAREPQLRSKEASVAQKRRRLEELQARRPYLAWIGLAGPDGVVQAATGAVLERKSVAEQPWFQGGKTQTFTRDVHNSVQLAQALGSADGKTKRLIDIAVPVRSENGALVGVLRAALDLSWLTAVLDPVTVNVGGAAAELLVVAREGHLLVGPASLEEDAHVDGVDHERSLLGRVHRSGLVWSDDSRFMSFATSTAGYYDYEGLGWTVIARVPSSVATRNVAAAQARLVVAGLPLTAFLCLFAAWTGRREKWLAVARL